MLKGILQVEMKACKAATEEQIKVLYSVVKVNRPKNTDYLLACKVSTEKSQNLMGDPIHEVAFSCCFYNSLSWVFDSLITILLGVNFFGFL